MHPEQAAAYYAKRYGSARAALNALAGTWVDAEDRETRQILEGLAYKDAIAAQEASRQAIVEKAAMTVNFGVAA